MATPASCPFSACEADLVALDDVAGRERAEDEDAVARVALDDISGPGCRPAHGALGRAVNINSNPDRVWSGRFRSIGPDQVAEIALPA